MADRAAEPRKAATTKQWIMLGVLVVILIVVLGVLVVRPLLSGGGDAQPAPAALPSVSSTPAPTPAPDGTTKPGPTSPGEDNPGTPAPRTVSPAILSRASKDPFQALLTPSDSSGGTTSDGGDTSGGSSGGGSDSGDQGGGGADSDTSSDHRVSMVAITGSGSDRTVEVTVDGTSYSGQQGDTIAGTYEVTDISSECADFSTDDGAFTLCEGDAALK
jgi:hypothetical protein